MVSHRLQLYCNHITQAFQFSDEKFADDYIKFSVCQIRMPHMTEPSISLIYGVFFFFLVVTCSQESTLLFASSLCKARSSCICSFRARAASSTSMEIGDEVIVATGVSTVFTFFVSDNLISASSD
mmetsp:Transcript_18171/g.32950  ORF Transcript_18171/g.32950 Transcript_18171/m.32950 type:complete len:125 (-) Transcript_18171:199-573(-)